MAVAPTLLIERAPCYPEASFLPVAYALLSSYVLHRHLSVCLFPLVLERLCFTAPLDEDDLEEDADSEPAETEGEAAEDGDPGDTGAELDGMGLSLPSLPLWWTGPEWVGLTKDTLQLKFREEAVGRGRL